jgi:hypothetical protein
MTIILPYFALRFIYGLPVTPEQYWETIKPMIFGTGLQPGGQIQFSTIIQWLSMAISYGHGMYLPYTNAVHCYKIDQLMLKGSKAVIQSITQLREISDIWISYGLRKPWSFPDPSVYGDERQILAWLNEDPTILPAIYKAIGQVEIMAAITMNDSLVPVKWQQSGTPFCCRGRIQTDIFTLAVSP